MDPISSSTAGSIAPKSGVLTPAQGLSAPKTMGTPSSGALSSGMPSMEAPSKADSVELSLTAQIRSLKLQGQSLSQIAIALGLDTSTVASYLGETA